ncbi:fungal-specific transcription factor domain-containing protein [Limtongia smithiae]|uniref:fungal-specific transcription factor domain-containing protein n=1 Tax=Limtongia smithiae TaxID=1125753 RepID=UPI0034CF208D
MPPVNIAIAPKAAPAGEQSFGAGSAQTVASTKNSSSVERGPQSQSTQSSSSQQPQQLNQQQSMLSAASQHQTLDSQPVPKSQAQQKQSQSNAQSQSQTPTPAQIQSKAHLQHLQSQSQSQSQSQQHSQSQASAQVQSKASASRPPQAVLPSAAGGNLSLSAQTSDTSSSSTVGSSLLSSSANSALNRPFYTRNRRERPCDGCRRRKTRCLRPEGNVVCTMCVSHDEVCTFVLEPPTRRRHVTTMSSGTIFNPQPGHYPAIQPNPTNTTVQIQSQTSAASQASVKTVHPHQVHNNGYHDITSVDSSTTGILIPPNNPEICTLEDQKGVMVPALKRSKQTGGAGSDSELTDERSDIMDPISIESSLGMNDKAYSELIGPNILDHEYQFVHRLSAAIGERIPISKANYLRPVSDDAIFLMTNDHELEEDYKLVEEIEDIVAPYGPQLVALYFRIVHPSYPIIHKTYFLSQYNLSPRNISPPLLAAVYSLAWNWCAYDPELSQAEIAPDNVKLDEIAYNTTQRHLHRARLSTVQAGLLLIQRKPEAVIGGFNLSKTQISAFTAQLVSVAMALGLHLDCSRWSIPSWEIPLRRRVAWALFVQDRWVALCHGRPCYIDDKNWLVPMLELDDFCVELSSASGVDHGAELLIEISSLTAILSEILQTFFFADYTRYKHEIREPQVVFELAKPLQLKLRQWHSHLSDCLYMKPTSVVTKRLCTTGYLHLAYYTVEITLHRAILRALEGCTDSVLILQFRTAANDRANAAVNFVRSLSAEYLEAFWIHSSRDCLVEIGQYIALLEATATSDEEAKVYRDHKESFQWHLRVHSRAAWMFEYALLRLEKIVWSIFSSVPSLAQFRAMAHQPKQPHLFQNGLSPPAHGGHTTDLPFVNTSPMLQAPTSQPVLVPPHQVGQHPPQQAAPQQLHLKAETPIDMAGVSEFWGSPASSQDDGLGNSVSNGMQPDDHRLVDYADVGGMLFEDGFNPVSSV